MLLAPYAICEVSISRGGGGAITSLVFTINLEEKLK